MSTIFQSAIAVAAAVVLLMAAADAAAQEQMREQVKQRTQERAGQREIIPGSELMTSSEREDYRRRYARAKTVTEQEKVRAEHVKAMEGRARLRGLQLAQPVATGGDTK